MRATSQSRRAFGLLAALLLSVAATVAVPRAAEASPANDNRVDAVSVAFPGTVTGTTVEATSEPDEPGGPCGASFGHTATTWFKTTVTGNGTLNVDTFGSNFDTVLAVYDAAGGIPLACNDDSGGLQSATSVSVTTGTYYFQVRPFTTSSGGFVRLTVDLGEAPPSSFGTWTINRTTVPNTGTMFADRLCVARSSNPDRWIRIVPQSNGTLTLDTFGSSYDTVLTLLTGTSLTPATCNDDAPGGTQPTQSRLSWPVTAGTRYYAIVSGYDGATGSLVLHASGPGQGLPGGAPVPPPAPGAPTGVSAVPGNATATVSWSAAPASGTPITGYRVTTSPGNTTQTFASPDTTQTISGLVNGTAYTFTVTAFSDAGYSAPSQPSATVTPATVPGAPTGVVALPGDGSAAVSWTAPADDGGAAVDHYTVTCAPACGTVQTPGTSAVVDNLTNGTSYTFRVTATNSVGDGAPSAPSSSVTPTDAQPDLLIRRSSEAKFLGEDVYNTSALSQTSSTKAHVGDVRTFNIRLENDGTTSSSFRVEGSGSSPRFVVSYVTGVNDITADVVAGTFSTGPLNAGQAQIIKVKVKVRKGARPGAVKSVLVTAASSTRPDLQDAVKGKVKVVR